MKIFILLQFFILALAIQMLTGCGYAFLGTEEIDAWGFKAKFSSGVAVRAGINSVDQVDDNQGVNTRRNSLATDKGARY